jgi:two-component sensor histidine kinase
MPLRFTGREYSLQAHLIIFGTAILLPVVVLATFLLLRTAALEHAQLEVRLLQTANDLAYDIDREVARDFTVLDTLATLPSLKHEDWPAFYDQAKSAVEGRAYVVVIDRDFRQLVNTYVPYGQQPAYTGDPETARRMLATKKSDVSDLFVSLVAKTPVFNVNIPIIRDGEVRYILHLGHRAEYLVPLLRAQSLGAGWTTTLIDRKGVVIARSSDHPRFVGQPYPNFAEIKGSEGHVYNSTNLRGEAVLRAVVATKTPGWWVTVTVPSARAEAPLTRSLWQWFGLAFAALLATFALAFLFARAMEKPMRRASAAASALAHGEPIHEPRSSIKEANVVLAALEHASAELSQAAAQQQLLLDELSHRVKNVLAVVQAIVSRAFSEGRPAHEVQSLLMERLQALSRAHDLLIKGKWKGASLKQIVEAELQPFSDRVSVSGPDVFVDGKMVQTFCLVLHELATNAAKYGSLSNDVGRVAVAWSVEKTEPDARFHFRWQERDGPAVIAPGRQGFGSTLLERAFTPGQNLQAALRYEAAGLVYEIDAPANTFGLRLSTSFPESS